MLLQITTFLFPTLVLCAAMSDVASLTISNRINIALALGFAVLAPWVGLPLLTVGLHVATALGVLVIAFGLFVVRQIGGGDAKLAAAIALWVGPGLILEFMLLASLVGGALTLGIVVARSSSLPQFAAGWVWANRIHKAKKGIPYGLALAAGAILVYPTTEIFLRGHGG